LLGEQANVQSVQHTTGTRSSEVQLKVSCGIPRKRRDTAIGTNPKIIKDATEATRALGPLTIRLPLNPHSRRSHNLFLRE